MKKVILILFLSFSFLASDMRAVNAQDSHQMGEFLTLFPKARDSLNGLEVSDYKEVVLLVALTTKKYDSALGFTEEKIRTKCESHLRQAGLEPSQFKDKVLSVEVGILPGGALAVALRFFRTVVFEGKGAIYRKPAITWEKVSFGTHGNNTAFVMGTIDEMLDSFLNEYLKANPSQ